MHMFQLSRVLHCLNVLHVSGLKCKQSPVTYFKSHTSMCIGDYCCHSPQPVHPYCTAAALPSTMVSRHAHGSKKRTHQRTAVQKAVHVTSTDSVANSMAAADACKLYSTQSNTLSTSHLHSRNTHKGCCSEQQHQK